MPTTIVLLHGAALNGRMWDPCVAILRAEFAVFTPDLPGHGNGRQEPFSLDRAVKQVAALVERERPAGAVVAGDSLGGYTAMALASAHPNLVRGLVLAGCTAEFTGPLGWLARAASHFTGVVATVLGPDRLLAKTLERVRKTYPNAPLEAILAGGLKLDARREALLDLAGKDFVDPWPATRGRSWRSTARMIGLAERASPIFAEPSLRQSWWSSRGRLRVDLEQEWVQPLGVSHRELDLVEGAVV